MSAIRVARHEIRQAWRTRVLALLGIVVALLLVGAAAVGHSRYAMDVAQRARFQAVVGQQWDDQPDRHPHRVSHYGFLVFRPRAPLAFFDTGVETFTGSSLFLEAHRQNSANFSEASYADGSRRFGELTMAMVLQLFVPLLLFAIAGVAVTREREAGTLSLLLCQGTPWRSFLWGKLTGALVAVACVVAPGVLFAAGWLFASRSGATGSWWSDEAVRIALLVAAHGGYLVACTAGAILVSALSRTSRGALVTLVSAWIALWIVVPRALPGVAASLYPIPSRAAFEAQVERRVRTLGDSHNPNDPNFQALRADYLARYNVSRLEDLPINYNGIVMIEGEKLTTNAYRQHLSALLDTYRQQARIVELTGFLSPYVAIRNVSMALSGVDVAHSVEFERQAEDYRYALIQQLNRLHTEKIAHARDRYIGIGEGGAPTRERISREHWTEQSEFTYETPNVAWALAHQGSGVAALLLWITGLTAAMAFAGRRPVEP